MPLNATHPCNSIAQLCYSQFLCCQISVVKDDDDYQVNGELMQQSKVDDMESMKSSLSTADYDNYSSEEAVDDSSLTDEASLPPAIHVTQDECERDEKTVENKDKPDDVYNFEFSEDQKQAMKELFNLKLDLGFTAG